MYLTQLCLNLKKIETMTKIDNQYEFIQFVKHEIINNKIEDFFQDGFNNIDENRPNYGIDIIEMMQSLSNKQQKIARDFIKQIVYNSFFHFFAMIDNKESLNGDFELFFQTNKGKKIRLNDENSDELAALLVDDYKDFYG